MTESRADRWSRLQALFERCVGLDGREQRAVIAEIEHDDPAMAAELQRLLAADGADDPIAGRLGRYVAGQLASTELAEGQRVGPYSIERLLGRGGMGAVYLARRADEAYQQQVVVKLVDAPLGDAMHARFERERQILADLNHPNITRLLDGGTLENGVPYLVMEYVRGTSIAHYCEQRRLPLAECLRLFAQVCNAVQFAHAHLVVHRDIKPDNVLVNDQSGEARLLDFGIAKLLDNRQTGIGGKDSGAKARDPVTDDELTLHGGALLSPGYASPEQRRGAPITTASDIYSLGALLYRLLTGRPPHASGDMREPSIPAPSAVLAGEGRHAEARAVRGDLDAIAMCALAEDPGERYPTASALAEDLARFLGTRPVRARHGGWFYAVGKFTRRNRALAATLAATVLLVLGFSAGVSWLAVRLEAERERALASAQTTEQIADFMVALFAGADPETNPGELPDARDLLDRGAQRIAQQQDLSGAVRSQLLYRMALAYRNLGLAEQALDLHRQALEHADPADRERWWMMRLELADLYRENGAITEAATRLRAAISELEVAVGSGHGLERALAKAYNDYGIVVGLQERPEDAERWARRALALDWDADPDERELTRAKHRHNLAIALSDQGRHDEAVELMTAVIAAKKRHLGEIHPSVLLSLEVMASDLRKLGRFDEAAGILAESIDQRMVIYGADSVSVARVNNELANVYHDAGRYREAEAAYRAALAALEQRPDDAPLTHAYVVNNLAALYEDSGDLVRAEPMYRRSIGMRIALNGDQDISVLRARINLARLLIKLNRVDEAGALLDAIDETLAGRYPDNAYRAAQVQWQRAMLAVARGDVHAAVSRIDTALGRFEEIEPETSFGLMNARLDAARIHLQAGSHAEAGRLLDLVERLAEARFAEDHPKRLINAVLRAEILFARGDRDAARARLTAIRDDLVARFHPSAPILRRARALLDRTSSPVAVSR